MSEVIQLTRENYHQIVSLDGKPLVSSSCLQYAYPGQGGSVARLGAYFDAQESAEEEVEKAHQELGSLLHLWLEDHNKFAVESADRPDPWICEVIDHALASVPGRVDRMEDLKPLLFPAARALGAQPKWGEEAIVRNVAGDKGVKYFHWRLENNGKQMVTASCREKLEGMQASISRSAWGEIIIERKHPTAQVLNELAIQWDYQGIPCKSLLDLTWIEPKRKVARVNDFKTTSSPIGTFLMGSHIQLNNVAQPVIVNYPGTFYRYRYYRQLAFYGKAIEWYIKKLCPEDDIREWKIDYGIFAVGTVPPYEVIYIGVSQPAIFLGMQEVKEAFDHAIIPYFNEKGLLGWK